MTASELIRLENDKLINNGLTSDQKKNIIFNLIHLKNNDRSNCYKHEIYVDAKNYIDFAIKATRETGYGYDDLDATNILKLVDLLEENEKLSLMRYFTRRLEVEGLHEIVLDVDKYIKKLEIKVYFKAALRKVFCSKDTVKLISSATSYNLLTLAGAMLVFYLVAVVLLLPSPSPNFYAFKFDYEKYSQIGWVNHAVNVLAIISGAESGPDLNPVNALGVLLILTAKCFNVLVITNFVIKKIGKNVGGE